MVVRLRLRDDVVAAHKTKALFDMFKLPYTSSQGYQVISKPKLRVLGASAAATVPTINEQKTKSLFNMFGLRL